MIGDYADWAAQRLVPGDECDPDEARRDYLMWCSDRRLRPALRSKQRGAVRGVGGVPKGIGEKLRYLGVTLAPLPPDSGYRAGGRWQVEAGGPEAVLRALRAVQAAGLVTDRAALNRAYAELKEE